MSAVRHVAFVGNGGIHLAHWARLLAGSGVRVDLVATKAVPGEWPFGEVLHAWRSDDASKLRQLAQALRASRALRRAPGAQLVHAHYAGKPAWIAARSGLPMVVSVWGGDVCPTTGEFSRWWIRRLTLSALERAGATTVHSQALLDRLLELGRPRESLHLIPWGVARCFRPSAPATPWRDRLDLGAGPVVLSLRWTDPIYQIDRIAGAFADLAAEFPAARLVLRDAQTPLSNAGAVRALVEARGIADRVRWVGWISRDELADLYRTCDVGISYPSTDGYPISVQEAMSTGLVPIVSDLPGTEGLVEPDRTGLVVDPSEPGELREALRLLLAGPDRRTRYRAALTAFAEGLPTPEEGRDRLLEIYGRLLARRE